MMLLVSGLFSCRAAFCEERGTAINANGNLNRAISVDPTGRSEGFSAVLYNNTNGLPTSEANAIAETSEGFLWIGSYAGLIRYDGNSFKRFDSTHGVTSVRCLYVDSRDRLWIGTNADGVTVMEKGEFQTWGRNEGVRSVVRAIAEDSDGVIYLATTEGILTIGQDMKPSEITEPGLSGNVINISIAS
ncbi:MAG: histidine kinase, partial [Clostridia bacterium]|nr:histidine kinase [Clostridia bacterium]